MRYVHCPACGSPLAERIPAGDNRARLVCTSDGCTFVHYGNPTPVVAAIVEHEGAIVLVRNRGWPEKMFGLVTGFLEAGETPEAGVLREVKEELGLDASIAGWVGVYSFFEMNQILLVWHVRAKGAIALGDELAAYKAVAPDKLRPWPMGTGHAVADWLAARARTGG